MKIKDFLPVILNKNNYPDVRILEEARTREAGLLEPFYGKALNVPYCLLDRDIEVIRSCGGCFEIHLEKKGESNETKL